MTKIDAPRSIWRNRFESQLTKYEAIDGKQFDTADECRDHEADECWHLRLIGLGKDDLERALDRVDVDLADAIERAGNIIAKKRRESGDFRRASQKRMVEEVRRMPSIDSVIGLPPAVQSEAAE